MLRPKEKGRAHLEVKMVINWTCQLFIKPGWNSMRCLKRNAYLPLKTSQGPPSSHWSEHLIYRLRPSTIPLFKTFFSRSRISLPTWEIQWKIQLWPSRPFQNQCPRHPWYPNRNRIKLSHPSRQLRCHIAHSPFLHRCQSRPLSFYNPLKYLK